MMKTIPLMFAMAMCLNQVDIWLCLLSQGQT